MNFFTALAKLTKILPVLKQIQQGIVVAIASLTTTADEIEKIKPDFRYLDELRAILGYMQKVADILESILLILGASTTARSASVSTKISAANIRKMTNDLKAP